MAARMSLPALPQTIIHLGARRGDRLAEFRATGASNIVLVEPEAAMAAGLQRQVTGMEGVRVLAAAAGTADGRGRLSVVSLPKLNSLARPGPGLAALYPGLRLEAEQEVDVVSPQRLLRDVDPAARPLLLVLETPGQELALLEAWKGAGALERIDLLELHCSEEVLFEGAADRATIEAWLVAEGFTVTNRDGADPDWPVLHLQLDHTARALTKAEAQIVNLAGALTQATATLAETEAKLKAATDRAAALDKALTEARTGTEAKAATLTETEAKLKAATDRAATLDKALAEARTGTEAKAATLAETEAKLKAATDRIVERDTSIGELTARQRSLTDERDAAVAKGEALRIDLATAQTQLGSARSDLALAIRLQAATGSDLEHMRTQYETVCQARDRQATLLQQLTSRLHEAASLLRKVSVDNTQVARLFTGTSESRSQMTPAVLGGQGHENEAPPAEPARKMDEKPVHKKDKTSKKRKAKRAL